MVTISLIVIAAISNAIMDICSHKYHNSIFYLYFKKYSNFWNAETSWKNKYIDRDVSKGRKKTKIYFISFNKPVQLTDAWHLFKSIMIIALIGAIVMYKPISNSYFLDLIILGTIWNLTFVFFYKRILYKPKKTKNGIS